MVFLDSNIFIIDRFFPRDHNFSTNKLFLEKLESAGNRAHIPFYTLLEICGIASFNMSIEEQKKWLYSFSDIYPVEVLDPLETEAETLTVSDYYTGLVPYILKKMTVGDAIFLREAELHNAKIIVTWNIKHFVGRSNIPVCNPGDYF